MGGVEGGVGGVEGRVGDVDGGVSVGGVVAGRWWR